METWCILLISLSICVILKFLFTHLTKENITHNGKLPPGPRTIPIIGNLLWLIKPMSELESILRNLHAKYGPIITLHIGTSPAIFVATHSLAHQALIQNGAIFADRPPLPPTVKIITSNQHNISTAFYGPTWRLLRRNLTSEILHPSRIKSYSFARKWVVLDILINRLESQSKSGDPVPVRIVDHFRYAMFCLSALMCFGDKLEEKQIKEIEDAQRGVLLNFEKFNILDFWPSLGKILFRKRWEQLFQLRKDQENLLVPLIRARKKLKEDKFFNKDKDIIKEGKEDKDEYVKVIPYVDTLLDLQLADEKRKLEEGELVTLCSEFLDAGTDTTTTALQWIMANLVKYPHIQEKLFMEIKGVVGDNGDQKEVKEEDLQEMPYLKAVILEGLRRHPPGHFLLPHAVTQDVVLDGFVVPKNGAVNFMIAEMGWDPKVWKDPMAFRPERFLSSDEGGGEGFDIDITGSREIKMMPFGAGRRICPGHVLGMLHMEYFVANLVWNFQWMAVDDVNLSEKRESSMVMKIPLQAYISPRLQT